MNISANQLLQEAIKTLDQLEPGDSFVVKDLFPGIRWNKFPRNERLTLGTLFLNYAKTEGSNKIAPDGKNSANQQRYKVL